MGYSAGGEAGSESEPHDRAKAVCGCNPDKIQAGHGRLKTGREHGHAVDYLELRADLGTEESQPINIHFVAGCSDHVLGYNLALRAVGCAKLKPYAAVMDLGALRGASQL